MPETPQKQAPATPPQPSAVSSIANATQDVDPRSNRAKVERTLALRDRIAARLAQEPPVRIDPRTSPIEIALREFRDVIVAAKARRGWTNKQLAEMLRSEGVAFKQSSLYLRLQKLFPPHSRKPGRKPVPTKPTSTKKETP